MDTVTQRLPLEVYQLVDKTITEVQGRHTLEILGDLSTTKTKGAASDRIFDNNVQSQTNSEVLTDLLWTLYSKLAAVLSGHRVVHDCVLAITKDSNRNEHFTDMPEFNYIEVWKPIQSEVCIL